MSGCECKGGFFTLRDCDGAPAGACSECGRTACARHLSPASGFTQCLDCHARAEQQPREGQNATGEEVLDDEWTYGARHRFYTAGYAPLYAGSHRSHYYDSYDTRSFDDEGVTEAETDEGGAGFGDS
ncbi:MAG TPA: hypothetical protein PLP50_03050 [Thermoanaerobaculia bacterium]|nr:hypothetical protein [Thermoanaerobaculia bacterium]HQN06464.1 hypothetical protein [Thermoanaerobaculia bacterium]HQP84621.1 hypothetical protein [Thermoanaerobaculia bacterium]